MLSALLPLGLSIPAGVSVAVDEIDPVTLELRRCVPAGCIAGRQLSEAETAAMRLGVVIAITFTNAAGRTITLDGSLDGISAGLDLAGWD